MCQFRLTGKKVGILAEKYYETLELWYPYYRFKEEGAEVVVIGSGSAPRFECKHGYPVEVDVDAGNIKAEDLDGIIIPGGWAPDHLRRYPEVVNLVKECFEAGKVVAAICHAGSVLVSAQVLQGRTVTSFMAIKDDMINAGANFVDQEVVRDGNLITSRTPKDLPAFCREMISALAGS